MKYAKSVGPPGTGKTTYLLKQIERDCDRYFHRKIGAVSLTTAAVSEIRGRIARHLDIKKEDAENVRTIHSHCYKLLNMRKDGVAETSANIKKFNQMWPQLAINGGGGDDITEYAAAKHHNQQAFNDMQNYRNRMIPVDSWKNPLAVKMNDAWTSFMNENDLTDFTGMLERALSISEAPDMDVIYIDECQDTSVLAMNVLMKWAAGTQKAVFIGDTDQALFRFSGAVPEVFGNLKTDWSSSLKQSYRVPEKVHEFAMKIIRKIPGRADVEYIPYNEHAYNMINESGGNAPQWYCPELI